MCIGMDHLTAHNAFFFVFFFYVLRTIGIGVAAFVGKIGAIIAPFSRNLVSVIPTLSRLLLCHIFIGIVSLYSLQKKNMPM